MKYLYSQCMQNKRKRKRNSNTNKISKRVSILKKRHFTALKWDELILIHEFELHKTPLYRMGKHGQSESYSIYLKNKINRTKIFRIIFVPLRMVHKY